jgi:alkanesulfonate monooxygenase SsuD/methylene tetrahydromethanopterin reductase-like flavin-dependent oxidoreductase (luciferase family)
VRLALGLPIADVPAMLDWGRRAEEAGFASVAVFDRWVWDNPEPLVALAAIAGATTRVRLQTEVLLAPLRDPVLLAKQAATLDAISRGRLTLGLGVGGRPDDFAAAGIPFAERGRRMEAALGAMRRVWSGDAGIGPAPTRPGGPEVLIGGHAPIALRRVARHADGVIASTGVDAVAGVFDQVRAGWSAAGRAGRPRLVAQVDVALGPPAVVDAARRRLTTYYAYLGAGREAAAGLLATPEAIRDALGTLARAGADEVTLFCWASCLDQVERLAAAAGTLMA